MTVEAKARAKLKKTFSFEVEAKFSCSPKMVRAAFDAFLDISFYYLPILDIIKTIVLVLELYMLF